LEQVHKLQDLVTVNRGKNIEDSLAVLELPHYDPITLDTHRKDLRSLFTLMPDSKRMFGEKSETDDIAHLVGKKY
jgi:hypothetical protein